MRLEGWQIVVVVVLAIILFGAPKLPGLARSLGQSLRIFKSEVKQLREEDNPEPVAEPVHRSVVPVSTPVRPAVDSPDPAAGQPDQPKQGSVPLA